MYNVLHRLAPERKEVGGITIVKQALAQSAIRIYRPAATPSGAGLLWIHGGGLISGRASKDDYLCASYANSLHLTVVSVDYRLAPGSPFPAALNDCCEAWRWFLGAGESLGVHSDRIVVSGRSAGGGLAASLVQKLYDEGGVQPAGQALFSPMLDDRTAADYALDAINHRIWNNTSNRAGWLAYLGTPPGMVVAPEYSVPARRVDLSGLPPAWIGVGDIDLFFKENCHYCERLKESGVECEMHVAPMAPHGFEGLVPQASITQDLFRSNHLFLQRALSL